MRQRLPCDLHVLAILATSSIFYSIMSTKQPVPRSAGSLKVLTLNCWGLLLVSKQRVERMKALASFLSSPSAKSLDIVCLQEIWNSVDADQLRAAARSSGLSHCIHFRSGLFGAGLVTLSRYPFTDTGLSIYAAAGDPLAITCGDYYAAKGVGWVRVLTPAGPLDVFNTHLHANYSHKVKLHPVALHLSADSPTVEVPLDGFAPYRISQLWQLTQYIQHVSSSGSIGSVLAGDLNAKPDSLEMALLRGRLQGLHDSWQHVHPTSDKGSGFTCDSPECTYTSIGQVPERIDYVLSTLLPLSCSVELKMAAEAGVSYSDHFAVQAELELLPPTAAAKAAAAVAAPTGPVAGQPQLEVLQQCVQILDEGVLTCRQAVAGAKKASALCLVICLVSIAALVTPGLGPALPWGHGSRSSAPSGSAAVAVTGLETLGMALLLLAAVGSSALSALLLFKAHLADAPQERALQMSALGVRVTAGLAGAGAEDEADEGGRKGAVSAAPAAAKGGAAAGAAAPAAAASGKTGGRKKAAKKAGVAEG